MNNKLENLEYVGSFLIGWIAADQDADLEFETVEAILREAFDDWLGTLAGRCGPEHILSMSVSDFLAAVEKYARGIHGDEEWIIKR